MDTQQKTEADQQAALKAYVDGQLAIIKAHMPLTYQTIKTKAGEVGGKAYALVRLGIAGKPNCFYAIEGDRAVGTPFVGAPGMDTMANYIKQFGCKLFVLWAQEAQQPQATTVQGVQHGAN
jgi:hypothetical protein